MIDFDKQVYLTTSLTTGIIEKITTRIVLDYDRTDKIRPPFGQILALLVYTKLALLLLQQTYCCDAQCSCCSDLRLRRIVG